MVKDFQICGQSHPRREWVVCTKEFGHDGKHGHRKLPMRCVLWDCRSGYRLVPQLAESGNKPNG